MIFLLHFYPGHCSGVFFIRDSKTHLKFKLHCICIRNGLYLIIKEIGSMANAVLQTRVDLEMKKEAEDLFESLGLDLTTAIRLFLKQSINQKRIPFEIVPPQEEFSESTLAAIEEARKISRNPKTKRYSSAKELLKDCE
jgi:DNA-damage-inducible protein J